MQIPRLHIIFISYNIGIFPPNKWRINKNRRSFKILMFLNGIGVQIKNIGVCCVLIVQIWASKHQDLMRQNLKYGTHLHWLPYTIIINLQNFPTILGGIIGLYFMHHAVINIAPPPKKIYQSIWTPNRTSRIPFMIDWSNLTPLVFG